MTRTFVIRDIANENRVSVEYYDDNNPTPRAFDDYDSALSARVAHPDLAWHKVTPEKREEEEISGDVLYVATVRA